MDKHQKLIQHFTDIRNKTKEIDMLRKADAEKCEQLRALFLKNQEINRELHDVRSKLFNCQIELNNLMFGNKKAEEPKVESPEKEESGSCPKNAEPTEKEEKEAEKNSKPETPVFPTLVLRRTVEMIVPKCPEDAHQNFQNTRCFETMHIYDEKMWTAKPTEHVGEQKDSKNAEKNPSNSRAE